MRTTDGRGCPGTPYAASITHAGDWVAVACGQVGAVGIDVEALDRARRSEAMTRLVLAPAEKAAWATIPEEQRQQAFVHYWTAKEAVLKATGDGLRVAMTRLAVSPPNGGPPTLLAFDGRPDLPATLRLTPLDRGDHYKATLATIGEPHGPITEHDAMPLLDSARRDVAL